MNDFSEKRSFYRMAVNGPVKFRINGDSQVSKGSVMNLSSTGLLIAFEKAIPIDARMFVEITPTQSITPPLAAEVSVLRSDQDKQKGFLIACRIEKILSEDETGPDYP
ncbi:MAG: PilZ domain-containing protein [Candidatus Thiodiazotropha sp.]|jgi:hypothetical protein